MTDKEKQLISKLLHMASDKYANHGCNDVPDEFFEGWTTEEQDLLEKKMHAHNVGIVLEDIPEDEDEWIGNSNYDWWLMSYFADVILKEI